MADDTQHRRPKKISNRQNAKCYDTHLISEAPNIQWTIGFMPISSKELDIAWTRSSIRLDSESVSGAGRGPMGWYSTAMQCLLPMESLILHRPVTVYPFKHCSTAFAVAFLLSFSTRSQQHVTHETGQKRNSSRVPEMSSACKKWLPTLFKANERVARRPRQQYRAHCAISLDMIQATTQTFI